MTLPPTPCRRDRNLTGRRANTRIAANVGTGEGQSRTECRGRRRWNIGCVAHAQAQVACPRRTRSRSLHSQSTVRTESARSPPAVKLPLAVASITLRAARLAVANPSSWSAPPASSIRSAVTLNVAVPVAGDALEPAPPIRVNCSTSKRASVSADPARMTGVDSVAARATKLVPVNRSSAVRARSSNEPLAMAPRLPGSTRHSRVARRGRCPAR